MIVGIYKVVLKHLKYFFYIMITLSAQFPVVVYVELRRLYIYDIYLSRGSIWVVVNQRIVQ